MVLWIIGQMALALVLLLFVVIPAIQLLLGVR